MKKAALSLLVLVSACGLLQPDPREAEGKRVGDEVVSAINAYKRDAGHYPQNLETLVPRYIGRIPEQKLGNPDVINFFYEVQSPTRYRLKFQFIDSAAHSCFYTPDQSLGQWTCSSLL